MKGMMIIGMFPGFMSMVAVYNILKGIGINRNLGALILVGVAGAAMGYYICKGFFDTIPASLRESARLEGASELQIFTKVVIPLSKPMIVYTVINAFLTPWMDFVMARLMIRSKEPSHWTVAVGLFNLVQRTLVGDYFSVFCAGGLIVALPISVLFIIMQRFYVEGITGGAVKG
jgi:arabinogalactan oligomer/maltooligosaccharide transport system permease protein